MRFVDRAEKFDEVVEEKGTFCEKWLNTERQSRCEDYY
jgi:hypothetical protein